jgi:hypothetical protein
MEQAMNNGMNYRTNDRMNYRTNHRTHQTANQTTHLTLCGKLRRSLHTGLIAALGAAAIHAPLHAQEAVTAPADEATHPSVVVTIAPNRPPCDDVYASAGQNCYGTRATTHSFPVPLGSVLWFPQQPSERVSWVFVGPVVIRPANFARALWMRIDTIEDNQYRLTAGLDDRETQATMASENWTPVQIPLEQSFWVRVEPAADVP